MIRFSLSLPLYNFISETQRISPRTDLLTAPRLNAVIPSALCLLTILLLSLLNTSVSGQEQKSTETSNYQLSLGTIRDSKYISPNFSPVFPSLSGPEIELKKPSIDDLKWSEEDGISANIRFNGTAFFPGITLLDSKLHQFSNGYLYVNGEHFTDASITLAPSAESHQTTTKPASHSSADFNSTVTSIPLTEGNNVLEVVFTDPITKLEGTQLVSLVIALNGTEFDKPAVESLTLLNHYHAGEARPYLLYSREKDGSLFKNQTIVLGDGEEKVELKFKQIGGGNHALAYPDDGQLFRFFLLPSTGQLSLKNALDLEKKIPRLILKEGNEAQANFLTGFSAGLFAFGGDIVTNRGTLLPELLQPDNSTGIPSIAATVINNNDATTTLIKIPVVPYYASKRIFALGGSGLPDLMWRLSKLYRDENPASEDATLALLTSDFPSLGISVAPNHWIEEHLIKSAEALDQINRIQKQSPPSQHGFWIGLATSTMMQADLPRPDSEGTWKRPLISDVLLHFTENFPLRNAGVSQSGNSENDVDHPPHFEVPDKHLEIWKYVRWYYEDVVWDGDVEAIEGMANLLPDSMKHPLISMILSLLAIIGIFGASLWFLVKEFEVSLGWGFGQLAANLVSCILFIPGTILAIVFCCLHWQQVRRPVTLFFSGCLIFVLAQLFVPSWTEPVSGE